MTTALALRPVLDLEQFARASGLHPEMIIRLVALGLLEPVRDSRGELGFPSSQLVIVARVQRLRHGFALNYAALGLVCDLLDRIEQLEGTLRHREQGHIEQTP